MRISFRHSALALVVCLTGLIGALRADPLTKQLDIDFGRDVASRNLKGLATRSDGRILPGPVFTDLDGPKLGEILWVLKPSGKNRFLVGTGPEGKVQEVTFNPKDNSYVLREVADVPEPQAIAVQPLADNRLLVGTSPTAAVYLVKDGKNVARVPLPADSVFDFLPLPDGSVLVATGNPGKIYRLDLKKLTQAGVIEGKISDDKAIADKGVTVFGEIRDRNVRRLARLANGRVIAGSSPKGNVYSFEASGGSPVILQENRDSEVVDLLPTEDGGFYAGIVLTAGDTVRIGKVADTKEPAKDREPKPAFSGRTTVVHFPADGFPENVVTKSNIALYRLARYQDWLLLTAGEQGDAFGYDPVSRRSLTFAGSSSSQLNDIASLGNDRYLILRNNTPGLAVLSFAAKKNRELETKRLDLGVSAQLGGLRFSLLRGIDPAAIKPEVRTNFSSDEIEGWSPWQEMQFRNGAYQADGLRGRYVRLRLRLNDAPADFEIDKATLYDLPQNRRPTLVDFRIFSPNLGLIPAAEQPPSATSTLSQLLYPGPNREEGADKRKGAFMSSQVIPQTGAQLIYWTVSDSDGDNLAYDFSIRPESSASWIDLSVNSSDNYVQFETGALAEGLYLTRLTATEQAPRPKKDRLTYAFETDNLLIDRTPPKILDTQIKRVDGNWEISIEGRDALSLLEGAEFILNNGNRETVLHPVDGILDSLQETFVAEIPATRASGATSLEIVLYDQSGNSSSVRLPLK